MSLPRLAVSIGDPNGVGPQLALEQHAEVSKRCQPVYCADTALLENAAELLNIALPENIETVPLTMETTIAPGTVTAAAGAYSYASFQKAIALAETKACDGIVTLPIHKEAWSKAGVSFKGHTDMLRKHFNRDAIMMLGCSELYVALYTEHIPLKEAPARIKREPLTRFLLNLYRETGFAEIAVLGLNPHAGDNGVLGDEETEITAAIAAANETLISERACNGTPFFGPVVPDVAFTPRFREKHRYIVAMYHDQGLAPLKALYFDRSVNISLNLPIIRTSVDHGTAFDIAYRSRPDAQSYLEAVHTAIALIHQRAAPL